MPSIFFWRLLPFSKQFPRTTFQTVLCNKPSGVSDYSISATSLKLCFWKKCKWTLLSVSTNSQIRQYYWLYCPETLYTLYIPKMMNDWLSVKLPTCWHFCFHWTILITIRRSTVKFVTHINIHVAIIMISELSSSVKL